MKLKADSDVFAFDSDYWENDATYDSGTHGCSVSEACNNDDADTKLQAFTDEPVRFFTVCYRILQNCYIYDLGSTYDSAKDVFSLPRSYASSSLRSETLGSDLTPAEAKQKWTDLFLPPCEGDAAVDYDRFWNGGQGHGCAMQFPGVNSVCRDGTFVRIGYCSNFYSQACADESVDSDDGIGIGVRAQAEPQRINAPFTTFTVPQSGFSRYTHQAWLFVSTERPQEPADPGPVCRDTIVSCEGHPCQSDLPNKGAIACAGDACTDEECCLQQPQTTTDTSGTSTATTGGATWWKVVDVTTRWGGEGDLYTCEDMGTGPDDVCIPMSNMALDSNTVFRLACYSTVQERWSHEWGRDIYVRGLTDIHHAFTPVDTISSYDGIECSFNEDFSDSATGRACLSNENDGHTYWQGPTNSWGWGLYHGQVLRHCDGESCNYNGEGFCPARVYIKTAAATATPTVTTTATATGTTTTASITATATWWKVVDVTTPWGRDADLYTCDDMGTGPDDVCIPMSNMALDSSTVFRLACYSLEQQRWSHEFGNDIFVRGLAGADIHRGFTSRGTITNYDAIECSVNEDFSDPITGRACFNQEDDGHTYWRVGTTSARWALFGGQGGHQVLRHCALEFCGDYPTFCPARVYIKTAAVAEATVTTATTTVTPTTATTATATATTTVTPTTATTVTAPTQTVTGTLTATQTETDLALNRPAVASSETLAAGNAVDGDTLTRWACLCRGNETAWIYVDLGAVSAIGRVEIKWETAYASEYRLEGSSASEPSGWTTLATVTDEGPGLVVTVLPAGSQARFVRMNGVTSGYWAGGFSIWDFSVYGLVLTTATTTATATSSTASSTTTMTTSSTRLVTCSLARLYCPLPPELAAATYQIEGNGNSPPGSCQMQGSGTARYFDVAIAECNVTQTQVPGGLNLSVTLIPVTGTIVFAGDPLPTLICGCFYDTVASVGTVAAVEVPTATRNITGGTASFNASLHLFPDDTFAAPLLPGATYPSASTRFYLEITTDNEEQVIGVPECAASPTNSGASAYLQYLREDYCDNLLFEPVLLSGPGVDNVTAKVRWSIVKFKFSGFTHVYVTCVVTRCSTPPCGACTGQGSGRRLDGSEQESAVEAVAVDLMLPPGAYMLLPGKVPEEGLLAKLTSPADPPRAGASGVSANLTIYGFPLIADVQRFVDQFRSAVSPYVKAQVYQVWQVHGFNGSSEVTRVGFYCTPDGAAESILAPVVQDHAESTRFISELLQELGFPNQRADLMHMDVNSANLTAPHATLPTAPAPSPGAAEVPAAIIAIIAVVGAALIAVAAVALVLWWRKVRTRASQRTMGKESAATNALEPTEKEPARAAVEDPGAVENSACESVIVSDPGNAKGEAREEPVAGEVSF